MIKYIWLQKPTSVKIKYDVILDSLMYCMLNQNFEFIDVNCVTVQEATLDSDTRQRTWSKSA